MKVVNKMNLKQKFSLGLIVLDAVVLVWNTLLLLEGLQISILTVGTARYLLIQYPILSWWLRGLELFFVVFMLVMIRLNWRAYKKYGKEVEGWKGY